MPEYDKMCCKIVIVAPSLIVYNSALMHSRLRLCEVNAKQCASEFEFGYRQVMYGLKTTSYLTQVQRQRIPCHHIDYQNNRDKIRKHLEIDVSMYEKLGRENCWPHATV